MGPPENGNAAPMAVGNGVDRTGASEGNLAAIYPTFSRSATEFAIATIARRWRLPAPTARVVVELARLGGQAA
ncbi:conserved hypothetical protein [Mesorhizobium ventifaucium]|uniref:Uncharacterized protein n=1 Tax=Mesorhizobium ventifaucium TaxID=666020 RepID=A0ABN8JT59_9HYPH|nr:conserved hypothetical protein [Mesorhizobium ventifaucium]